MGLGRPKAGCPDNRNFLLERPDWQVSGPSSVALTAKTGQLSRQLFRPLSWGLGPSRPPVGLLDRLFQQVVVQAGVTIDLEDHGLIFVPADLAQAIPARARSKYTETDG